MNFLIDNVKINYDVIADTLYFSISNDIADETLLDANHLIVRFNEGKVISVTIDGFKSRIDDACWDNSYLFDYFHFTEIKIDDNVEILFLIEIIADMFKNDSCTFMNRKNDVN